MKKILLVIVMLVLSIQLFATRVNTITIGDVDYGRGTFAVHVNAKGITELEMDFNRSYFLERDELGAIISILNDAALLYSISQTSDITYRETLGYVILNIQYFRVDFIYLATTNSDIITIRFTPKRGNDPSFNINMTADQAEVFKTALGASPAAYNKIQAEIQKHRLREEPK